MKNIEKEEQTEEQEEEEEVTEEEAQEEEQTEERQVTDADKTIAKTIGDGSGCAGLNYEELKAQGREELIAKCSLTQEVTEIDRKIIYEDNRTKIDLSITAKEDMENFTYYEFIPKCIALLIKEAI